MAAAEGVRQVLKSDGDRRDRARGQQLWRGERVPEAGPADALDEEDGSTLGIDPYRFTPEAQARYLADIHESESPCAREGIIHPSRLLRLGNWALMHNVVLGPWIHLGGTVTQLAPARVGDYLTVRGRVIANYERKGRRFLELDALIVANEVAPVAHLLHTAIYLQ